ncbi:MAG: PGF-pre-PGF domain-containing protein [Candidatus Hydrothermarchaeales archaeon]
MLKLKEVELVRRVKTPHLHILRDSGVAAILTFAFIFILITSDVFAVAPVILSVDVTPDSANTTDVLSCTVQATHPLNSTFVINITWYNGTTQFTEADYNNGSYVNDSTWTVPVSVGAGNTSKGEIWNCSATFWDADQVDLVNANGTETIANAPPNVTSVAIAPDPANTTDTLTGSGTYADADGDSESGSTYKWYRNGSVMAGETGTSLVAGKFLKDDNITFEYTPNDGASAGAAVNSSVLTISNAPPNVTSVSANVTNAKNGDWIRFTSSGASDPDNDNLRLECGSASGLSDYVNGSYGAPERTADWANTWTDNAVHTIYCRVNDGFVTSSDVSTTVIADKTAPTIDFTSPTPPDNANLSVTSVTINISHDETYPDTLILNWNGSNQTQTYSGLYTNISKSVSDGVYTYYAWVNDTAGNANQTPTRTLTVDNSAPAVGPVILNATIVQPGVHVLINATINDGTGVGVNSSTVRILVNGSAQTVTPNPPYYTAVYVNDTVGVYSVNVTAYDNLNNFAFNDTRSITVKTTAPSVVIVSPTNTTTNDNTPLLNATFGELVDTAWISINGGAGQNYTTGVSNLTFELGPLSDGPYNVRVFANDSAGNVNSSESVYFTVDTAKPTIFLAVPADGQTIFNSSVVFNFTPVDNLASIVNFNLTIDGSVNTNGTAPSGGYWTVFTDSHADGVHYWNVTVWDDAGNTNASETRNFTVLTQWPVPPITVPSIPSTTVSSGLIDLASLGVPQVMIEGMGVTGYEYIVTTNGSTPVVNLTVNVSLEPLGVTDIGSESGAIPGFYFKINVNDSSWFDHVTVIQLRIYYNITNIALPHNVPESTLKAMRYTNGSWVRLDCNELGGCTVALEDGTKLYAAGIVTSSVNATYPYVWANLSNFSVYGVGGTAGATDTDGDGVIDSADVCPDTVGTDVDSYGCPIGLIPDTANISGNVTLSPDANISGSVTIGGSANISGYATISGGAVVDGNAGVLDFAIITGNASVGGNAVVEDSAIVMGFASISGYATISGGAVVDGNAGVLDFAIITGNATINDTAVISGTSIVNGTSIVAGVSTVYDSNVTDSVVIDSDLTSSVVSDTPITHISASGVSIVSWAISSLPGETGSISIAEEGVRINFTNVYTSVSNITNLILDTNSSTVATGAGMVVASQDADEGDFQIYIYANDTILAALLEVAETSINPEGTALSDIITNYLYVNASPNINGSNVQTITIKLEIPSGYTDITIYRYNGTSWNALSTTTSGSYAYANTSGFSVFAVSASVVSPPSAPSTGGISPGARTQKEGETLITTGPILAGKIKVFSIPPASNVFLTELEIQTKKWLSGFISVKTLSAKPAGVATAPDKVFKYIDVSLRLINSEDITSVKLFFKVEKSWLEKEGVYPDTVTFYRFTTKWDKLETTKVEEDSTFVYYSAVSSGLSYFVISGKTEAPKQLVLLANSIDLNLSSNFMSVLRSEGIEITYTTPSDFSEHNTSKFIVILGGPDAYEGVGEIVKQLLSESEQEYLRVKSNRRMYVKTNVWARGQVVMVVAGSGRDQTRMEADANKIEVRKKVKGS